MGVLIGLVGNRYYFKRRQRRTSDTQHETSKLQGARELLSQFPEDLWCRRGVARLHVLVV
jgi:hypothetical protein